MRILALGAVVEKQNAVAEKKLKCKILVSLFKRFNQTPCISWQANKSLKTHSAPVH
jgi:hypothetical protein